MSIDNDLWRKINKKPKKKLFQLVENEIDDLFSSITTCSGIFIGYTYTDSAGYWGREIFHQKMCNDSARS